MVPFVYLASVCRFLQCLISALTQADGGGLLFRFACSVLLRGGRGTADRYRCVWGALALFRPHWVCPCFPWLLRLQAALYGACPALRAVPIFGSSTKARTRLGLLLCLPRRSSSGSQELDGRTLPGCGAPSPLRRPSLSFRARQSGALCVNPPGRCQPSTVSGRLWLETGGLFAVW